MDSLFLLIIGGLLAVIFGAVLGCIAFFRMQRIGAQVSRLEQQLAELKTAAINSANQPLSEEPPPRPTDHRPAPPPTEAPEPIRQPEKTLDRRPRVAVRHEPPIEKPGYTVWSGLKDNWMIWLGGLCVGLAGIFLVRYSIETGLLGPTQRIIAAVATGIGLHLLAHWLRRRTADPHPAFAALAGGASITLYAAMLAALHLYQLLNPGLVFTILALISLFTMLLALRDGPVLAIIGILGAYVVPLLVASDSDTILGALLYSLIISGAAMLLMRYVYRPWLWYGTLAGGLGWWLISLTTPQADDVRGLYLAFLAYGFLVTPSLDWLLRSADDEDERPIRDRTASLGWRLQPLQIGLLLIISAQALSIGMGSFSSLALLNWAPLPLILIAAAAHRASISYLPWGSLIGQWFAWLYCGLDLATQPIGWQGLGLAVQNDFLLFAAGMVAVYSGMSWLVSKRRGFRHLRFSLLCLAPVLWLALSYLLVTDLSVSWEWSAGSFILGITYIVLANIRLVKDSADQGALWLILAGHFAVALAAAMFLRQASLTLVLAVQVVSLVYLFNRFGVDGLKWLVRGFLALVVVRLTLNPWLLTYPKDIHWSLWTYGGATLCCGIAAWMSRSGRSLKKWLEAATLHLLVLFCAAETRYLLYDGTIFIDDYTLTEAAINSILWSALGLTYYYRSRVSDLLPTYYLLCSRILMVMAVANYALVLTVLNPLVSRETIGATPIWNLLLAAYGAPVVISSVCLWFYDKRWTKVSASLAGLSLFVFVSMEIRHLWQGALALSLSTGEGELYTYSLVWLIMAIAAILLAAKTNGQGLYQAGMGLLLLVIAKIFLLDMAGLEGLLRVASFMGLGLSLLGLAYLYQKLSKHADPEKERESNRQTAEEAPP